MSSCKQTEEPVSLTSIMQMTTMNPSILYHLSTSC